MRMFGPRVLAGRWRSTVRILALCEYLGREFWPEGGDLLCGIKRKSPKSFVRCARSIRYETGKFIYMITEGIPALFASTEVE